MRADMKKIVVERPRWGSRQSNRKFSARLKYVPEHDSEDQPRKAYGFESHAVDRGQKYFEKEFTDVLGPLKRFLRKNVGRPWNNVYSELCRGLDRRRVTGLHIFEHVKDFVETSCHLVHGQPYSLRYFGGYPVRWFYVHPDTGLLCEAPKGAGARRRKRAAALAEGIAFLRLSDEEGYRKHQGIWYRVKLSRIYVQSWSAKDAVVVYDIFRRREVTLYFGEHWVAVAKRQCNHDDLKQLQRLLADRERKIRKT